MDRMTPEQAAALLGRIDTLSDKLDVAEEQSERTHKLANRLRWVTIVLAAALILSGWAIWQNKQNQKTSCESGNNRVAGQRAWMNNYFDVADAGAIGQGLAADNPISVYYVELRAWTLNQTLPYRDCDHLDEPIPQPGKPPSFDEALKESLRQEARQ